MRLLSVFRKALREQRRDLWLLAMTLLAAPLILVIYRFATGETAHRILVLNQDVGAAGVQVMDTLSSMTYSSGTSMFQVKTVEDRSEAEAQLVDRKAAVLIIIPEQFSENMDRLLRGSRPVDAPVTLVGDVTSPEYAVAVSIAYTVVEQTAVQATGKQGPVQFAEEPLQGSAVRREFDLYVPGQLIFAVIMLIFLSAMTVTREIEAGTLRRLQLAGVRAADFLGGVSLAQVLIGVTGVLLTFGTAVALGFRSQGPLWVAILVGAVTALSIVGVGLLVACFSRTVTEAFIVGNLPLMLLMFFSGAMFPITPLPLFTVAGRMISLWDFLPPTHAVVALGKVLTFGQGLGDVTYELSMLLILSALYFGVGIWVFQRRQMQGR